MLNSTENITNADVIVVGGGLSGLTVSWELKKRDPKLRVLVLEAKDRLGGRTLSKSLRTATGVDVWDIGGQWIASTHKHMQEIVSELGLETFPQFTEGRKLIQLGDDNIKTYTGTIPNLSLPILIDVERNIRRLNKISRSIPIGNPGCHPDAHYYDSMTIETLSNKFTWTDAASRMMHIAIEAIFGAPPGKLSAWFFLDYISKAGGFDKLIETNKGGAQELRIKGGTQQISRLMADRIGLEHIYLSEPVTVIREVGDHVQVITDNGQVFAAQKVVMAIPLHLNADIEFDPALPSSKLCLFRNMQMGNLVKIVAVYEKAFWREKGYSGEVVNEGQGEKRYDPVDIVFDATSGNGTPALVAFMSGHRGIIWADAQPEERKEQVLKTLLKFFGEEALYPVSYIEKNWYLEPYNGGCPSSLCGPGLIEMYSCLSVPHGSIHWAGTETSQEWCGYMEGAVSSGKRASLEVLLSLRPDLLTPEEKLSLEGPPRLRRKSQMLRQRHKVFRYTLGLGLIAVGIVVLKKMYFRIAI